MQVPRYDRNRIRVIDLSSNPGSPRRLGTQCDVALSRSRMIGNSIGRSDWPDRSVLPALFEIPRAMLAELIEDRLQLVGIRGFQSSLAGGAEGHIQGLAQCAYGLAG